jgi:Uma2 family endonuclease
MNITAIPISLQEYLTRERAAQAKSEYYKGQIFGMAGTSRAHSLIVSNLTIEIGSQLRTRDCEIHSSDSVCS